MGRWSVKKKRDVGRVVTEVHRTAYCEEGAGGEGECPADGHLSYVHLLPPRVMADRGSFSVFIRIRRHDVLSGVGVVREE